MTPVSDERPLPPITAAAWEHDEAVQVARDAVRDWRLAGGDEKEMRASFYAEIDALCAAAYACGATAASPTIRTWKDGLDEDAIAEVEAFRTHLERHTSGHPDCRFCDKKFPNRPLAAPRTEARPARAALERLRTLHADMLDYHQTLGPEHLALATKLFEWATDLSTAYMTLSISVAAPGPSAPTPPETRSPVWDSLERVMATSPRDWSVNHEDAWLYGIISGWGYALGEVADRFGWSGAEQARLDQLHKEFKQVFAATPPASRAPSDEEPDAWGMEPKGGGKLLDCALMSSTLAEFHNKRNPKFRGDDITIVPLYRHPATPRAGTPPTDGVPVEGFKGWLCHCAVVHPISESWCPRCEHCVYPMATEPPYTFFDPADGRAGTPTADTATPSRAEPEHG